eukprot:TRINITY_DN88908_c0_g1_i1.p1 TRINITY_DN88908_c0_g1~~TRINITY_DN88908_c0_g1_i1.p1  ORF type:complete len:551 (-),score=49.72 TRINITY_DN88908_c0_g1_i1:77-1645(-)
MYRRKQRFYGGYRRRENSPAKPLKADQKESLKLHAWLLEESKTSPTHESPTILLEALHKLVKDWVYRTGLKKGLPLTFCGNAGGAVYIIGSHMLGVLEDSSDIDLLCVAPKFVDRDSDFFGDFLETLRANPMVTSLIGIKEAHVPLIKFAYKNTNVDLLFARVNLDRVDPETLDLKSDEILSECDKGSIYSINSYRNNLKILELVPDKAVFKDALNVVKKWAKAKDIYSNKLGYLGGISWAIMVAKVCQLFPLAPLNRLIGKFFKVFSVWKWNLPVLLCDINEPLSINIPVHNWNPRYSENDMQHLMPIITPAYPCLNSAFNVSNTTLQVMRKEFKKAGKITGKINANVPGYTWAKLLQNYSFFNQFTHFLKIEVKSGSEQEHLKSEGLLESKLRLLIGEVERYFNEFIKLRPCTKPFRTKTNEKEIRTAFFMGTKFSKKLGKEVDLREPVENFLGIIRSMSHQLGYVANVDVAHIIIQDIPKEILDQGGWKEPPKKRILNEAVEDEYETERKKKASELNYQ